MLFGIPDLIRKRFLIKNKMARIAFISLYTKGTIGIRYLSSVLKEHSHSISIIYLKGYETFLKKDLKDEDLPEDELNMGLSSEGDIVDCFQRRITEKEMSILLNLLEELNPDIIALTLESRKIKTAIRVTREIKKKFDKIVIWGGIGPTIDPEGCINFTDMVCVGEGEEVILELANKLDGGNDLTRIQNLWVRNRDTIIRNEVRPLIQDLDKIPFPDYDPINKYDITNGHLIRNTSSLNNFEGVYEIMASRGCPFSCSYCFNDSLRRLYKKQEFVRQRGVENVIEELKIAKEKHKVHHVSFYDDIFIFDKRWIREFSGLYKEKIGLPFWCYVHPLFSDRERLMLLKDCGLDAVSLGIQSGSERILDDVFDRHTSVEQILSASQVLHDLEIRYTIDIITNNPFENEDDCQKTLGLLLRLPRPISVGGDRLSLLSFFPNYRITNMLKDNELDKNIDQKRYSFYNSLYLLTQHKVIPKKWISLLQKNKYLRRHPDILVKLLYVLKKVIVF